MDWSKYSNEPSALEEEKYSLNGSARPLSQPGGEATAATPDKTYTSDTRRILCSHCHTLMDVPVIALSVFCKKCGQRINVQDYKIRGEFSGELDTRGTIYIAFNANVKAKIHAWSVIVDGLLEGEVCSEESIELTQNAKFSGRITAPKIKIDPGASIKGKIDIGPNNRLY